MEDSKIEINGVEYVRADSVLSSTPINQAKTIEDYIGKKLFIRTATYHSVGEVVAISDLFGGIIHLKNASWVADSGRYGNAIRNGELDEVEYLGEQNVMIQGIIDFVEWNNELPMEDK